MTEQPHEVLQRAADVLEERAGKATPGPWHYEGGAIHHPGTDRSYGGGATHHPGTDSYTIAPYAEWEDQTGNAHWICTMSPPVAAPLVALLRATSQYARALEVLRGPVAEDMHVEHALAFARMVLGEAS